MQRWTELTSACGQCQRCDLARGRQRVVVGRGNPKAPLLLLGEAPGQKEDEQGLPFVGRSGQLLDRLLEQAGFNPHHDLYICNVVKCRPPGNRKPTREESQQCRPWLDQQIQLVNPRVIVLAGATAMEALLGKQQGISKVRGQWQSWDQRWLMPVFHPSYLLRFGSEAEQSPRWFTRQDLTTARERALAAPPGPVPPPAP